jgi:hypothetical protein
MAKLVIVLDVDVDPAREDPHDIADAILDYGEYGALKLCDPTTAFVSAEWRDDD